MEVEDIISEIKASINIVEQTNIFSSSNKDALEIACVKYLKNKGYKIIQPKEFSAKIGSIDDLIKYFYLLANSSNNEDFVTSFNTMKDRSIAKRFVENRMELTGASKEYILNECGEIIKTVLSNKAEFNFKYAIDFSIFGQDKLKWVTDRAIQIMNKELRSKEEHNIKILQDKAIGSQIDRDEGIFDLDALLAEMDRVEE